MSCKQIKRGVSAYKELHAYIVDIFDVATLFGLMQTFASLLRASRALLNKEQGVVGGWVGLDRREVGRWEAGGYKLMSRAAIELKKALERHGIEFIDPHDSLGAGVRLRVPASGDPHRSAQYRAARALVSLSQAEVAKRAGVNRNFVARLELGRITGVNLETLQKLDIAYGELDVALISESQGLGLGVRWKTTTE